MKACRMTSVDHIVVKTGVTVRGVTVPVAKLDRTRRRIAVAWHEKNPVYSNSTRLRFATYSTATQGPWKEVIFASTGGHDLNVAIGLRR